VPKPYRFGEFELDPAERQLRSGGKSVPLESRPMDLLLLLVERRGHLVSREEIIAALWPQRVIIDFESGVNTLVRKVRNALGDSPGEPQFIETVPGRGYRFIAPVGDPAEPGPITTASPAARWRRAATLAIATLLAIAATALWMSGQEKSTQTRIAILPFENLTGDETLGYLATGIAEETNLALGRVDLPNLSVIGSVSAMALASSDRPLPIVGRELGVDFMVLSSLRLNQTRIRVVSRLIRISDGEQIWSAAFDRELTNLLGLQRELSIAIAEQIRQRLSPEVAAAIDKRQTRNPEAYELYLKGRYEWTRFQPNSVPRALAYYRQAVEKDPGYGLAWAGIAHAVVTSVATIEANRESVRAAAADALQRALDYGPDLAETQLAFGSYHGFLNRDLPAAEAATRQAIALDPNSAMSHMYLGLVLTQQDQYIEARELLRRARELDPLFPLMFANSANAALMAGEPHEALEYATQAVAINPDFWVGHLHLGTARMDLGDVDGAVEAFAAAERLSGNNSARAASSRAFILAAMGRSQEARDILDMLIAGQNERRRWSYYIAVIYAGLGDNDSSLEWLERGIANSDIFCIDIENDRFFRGLTNDQRFEQLANQCGRTAISGGGEQ
jgi:TolB-like protein/DNA-binding winged helix-turn-helix (wHTH) protein/Flp pilus assembly protein TadD